MAKYIEVLDSLMGSGKTTHMFKYMRDHPDKKFLFVTPLLSESEDRVMVMMAENDFRTACEMRDHPEKENKSAQLLTILKAGWSGTCTHELFRRMKEEHWDHIRKHEYIIVIDEQISLIEPLVSRYNTADFDWTKNKGAIQISETDGKATWVDTEDCKYQAQYGRLRALCESGLLYCAKKNPEMATIQYSVQALKYAKRVILLTYLYEGGVMDMYLRKHGIMPVAFTDFVLTERPRSEIKKLIRFVGDNQCKQFDRLAKEKNVKFSSTGYDDVMTQDRLDDLERAVIAIGKATKAKAADLAYCVPKDVIEDVAHDAKRDGRKKKFSPQSYKPRSRTYGLPDSENEGCYIPCNAIATNRYKHKRVMIHAFDRYVHPNVSRYLADYGFPVNQNRIALAELLQWIFRSRIRDAQPIDVCILPRRMRKLLTDWLNDEDFMNEVPVARPDMSNLDSREALSEIA